MSDVAIARPSLPRVSAQTIAGMVLAAIVGVLVLYPIFFLLQAALDVGDPDVRESNSPATQELNYRINLAVISCDDIKKSPKVQTSYFNGWHDTHPIFSTLVGYSWRLFGLGEFW